MIRRSRLYFIRAYYWFCWFGAHLLSIYYLGKRHVKQYEVSLFAAILLIGWIIAQMIYIHSGNGYITCLGIGVLEVLILCNYAVKWWFDLNNKGRGEAACRVPKQQLNTLRVLSLIFTHSLNLSLWHMANAGGGGIFPPGDEFYGGLLQSPPGGVSSSFKKHTSNPLKGCRRGALISALLQSSSIVNLLVLRVWWAPVLFRCKIPFALILGSNLGTTFTSWLLAMVGFPV